MRELVALTLRHLRSTVRGRAARAGVVLFLLGLGVAVLLPAGSGGSGIVLLGSLLVLALFVSGFAVGAGAALPEDRVAGRESWLAALAPPAWKRRLAVVLAGWLLAAAGGLAGGLLIGACVSVLRPDLALRAHAPFDVREDAVLTAGAEPVRINVPGTDEAGAELEIDVRPLFRLAGGPPPDRVDVAWTLGGDSGTLQASSRGPLRFEAPADARTLTLALRTANVRLRIASARVLGVRPSPVLALGWLGLLLGMLAAAVAPVAVFVSRATTVQTAAAAAFLLLLFGASKGALLDLAASMEPKGLLAVAIGIVEGLAWIAPDAPLLHLVGEAGSLRAPGFAAAGLLLPALLYTVVVCVPACVSAPLRWRSGVNA